MTNEEVIKIKTTRVEIIVTGKSRKPYFQIRYFDLSDHETHIGYGSYKLEFVFQWLEECFEIIKETPIRDDISLIRPISIEQYAEENTKLKAEIEQLKIELEQSVKEKSEVISKIEYALNECEPIYNKCAVIPQAKPIYDLAMNYCLDLLKGQV